MNAARIELTLPAWIDDEVDFARRHETPEARMQLAITLARRNVELGTGGPFGAAIFRDEGELIAVGVNRVVPQNCSAAHAEVMAFMQAQTRLQTFRLNQDGHRYILATSAQPCCMCYGASFWAGINVLEIGARSTDVMELSEFDEGPLPSDWVGEMEKRGISVQRDLLRDKAREVFDFYRAQDGKFY